MTTLDLNNTLTYSTAESNDLDNTRAVQTLKLLVFSIGSLNLALRIEAVYKVLNSTQIHGSGSKWVGLVHMGDREVTVLDLEWRIFQIHRDHPHLDEGYLIVVQNRDRELCGIPVATVPALIDVPLSSIRVLPESFRRGDTLGIASHVAVIPQEESNLTLFMLDIDAATKLTVENI